ncbi:MAG: D-alanine--D-alanine ligase [Calditerrivibrio sp.]|nr:D-alanine--D-alanine ligase [Calditerrivibrio sp.]MCA1933760.1 D-alanine--D-alanine ligase [Calditerrivibrio sp.]MCA1981106.1 D-alanine--D-alanine ligase [Calditerrivibrio sp.]
MLKDKIAVLYGGLSSEREVSLKTGKGIYDALIRKGYKNTVLIDVDWSIAGKLLNEKPDFCYIALHGRYGEDGTIQGLLEMMRIPYNGSGVSASAVAFDKILSKSIFEFNDIPTPNYFILGNEEHSPFYPCVVKPAREGSTIGITIVERDEEFKEAVNIAKRYDSKVLVEKFVSGKELTISIIDDLILPPIWIRPVKGFYDYESKYTKGMTEYIFETELSEEQNSYIKLIAKQAYDSVGCFSAARIDMIFDGEDAYVLEVNTLPGMTETSLLPNAARKYGISYEDLVDMIVKKCKVRYE